MPSLSVGESGVLWNNIRVMNVRRRRVKENPDAEIGPLSSEITRGAARYIVHIRLAIRLHQYEYMCHHKISIAEGFFYTN
jgi:hypothetical protein